MTHFGRRTFVASITGLAVLVVLAAAGAKAPRPAGAAGAVDSRNTPAADKGGDPPVPRESNAGHGAP